MTPARLSPDIKFIVNLLSVQLNSLLKPASVLFIKWCDPPISPTSNINSVELFQAMPIRCTMSQAVATVATWLVLSLFTVKHCEANVLFHYSLDFHGKQPANSTELINKSISLDNNQLSIQDNESSSSTNAPLQLWTEKAQYNVDAVQHLENTKRAVQMLNVELSPLVGRSNSLAASIKKTLRYVNDVDASLENGHFAQRVEQLRKYIKLVRHLSSGSKRTLEFVLLKLALEKYQLLEKYQEVTEYLKLADEAWIRYESTQVVLTEKS